MKHPSAHFSNSKASLKPLTGLLNYWPFPYTTTFERPIGIFTPPIAVAGALPRKICCFARQNRADSTLFA